MELVEYGATPVSGIDLPYDPITLVPLSDLQGGAPGCAVDRFKRHVELGLQEEAYFYWLGDAVDHASPSGRQKIRKAEFYDTTYRALEDKAEKDLEEVKALLVDTVGKTLFVLKGHHSFDFEDGSTTDERLAEYLGAPYLGTSTIFQLRFKREGKAMLPCQIFAHHGERAATSTSLMTRWMEVSLLPHWPTVDIFNIAHCHRAGGVKLESMVPSFGKNPKLGGKQRLLAVTGGWLRGYVVGNKRGNRVEGTYVEAGLMPPTALGGVVQYVAPMVGSPDYLELNIKF